MLDVSDEGPQTPNDSSRYICMLTMMEDLYSKK